MSESTEWIDVKQRLPEIGFHVIIYGIMRTQTVGYLRDRVFKGIPTGEKYWHVAHNNEKGCNWPLGGVTHWMPLPKPPEIA